MKIVLAINAGSSSVKLSVYSVDSNDSPNEMAEAQISGLTAPPAQLTYSRHGESVHKKKDVSDDINSQDDAFALLLETLVDDKELTQLGSKSDIAMACHRVVHGGDFREATVINETTHRHIEALSDLAPLHNGAALAIVDTCTKQLPDTVNVACFDSQYHTSMPSYVSTYPIDQAIADKNKLRRYGFHGISYAFIARSVADFVGKDIDQLNIIALHLGSGASACAIKGGKSHDTTMGLTPLSGLPGATRSGNVDPSLVFHYASDVGKLSPASTSHLHISRAEEILNKESGWKALTGTTDFGAIAAAATSDPDASSDKEFARRSRLAFDVLVDRITSYIGSYYVSLGGQVDALVFAGGIGEKSAELRDAVTKRVACLGFAIDADKNQRGSDQVVDDISADDEKTSSGSRRVLICQTDEQYEMARMCAVKKDLWKS